MPLQSQLFQYFFTLRVDGMENWGLVTYQEESLLIDTDDSVVDKQETAILVCHEIAHQWFGNLVTMVIPLFEVVSALLLHCIKILIVNNTYIA